MAGSVTGYAPILRDSRPSKRCIGKGIGAGRSPVAPTQRPSSIARWHRLLVILWLCAASLLLHRAAQAQDPIILRRPLTADELLNGKLVEVAPPGSKIEVGWTKKGGQVIQVENPRIIGANGTTTYDVPLTVDGEFVLDVVQETTLPAAAGGNQFLSPNANILAGGAISSLHIEAFGRSGIDLTVTRFVSAAWEITGGTATLWIPDVFADTNGDQLIGGGDRLYTAVDLYAFTLTGIPTYNIGDSVSIINGFSDAFPGMVFGTEPILVDPFSSNGFTNPSPLTTTGTISSSHGITSSVAPEPGTLLLVGVGLCGFMVRRRRPER